jgi:hypothetical protein
MRVPDRCVSDIRERGFCVHEGFLGADELAAAQEALRLHYPAPEAYFADPGAHAWLATSQWDGLTTAPWRSWDLNRLAFHPDLLDLVERALGSADLCLYDAELWAKYAGAADYEQTHHRDLGNHTLVVPKRSDPPSQVTAWILLSDVTEADGPTKVVPLPVGDDVPYWPDTLEGSTNEYVSHYLPAGAFAGDEVSVTGPAGTLFCLRPDLVHRASRMTGARSARFSLLANYTVWGPRWVGRVGWPSRALSPEWGELVERATPRERSVFGFPPPGDPYWDEQTLADTQARYPGADLSPYR